MTVLVSCVCAGHPYHIDTKSRSSRDWRLTLQSVAESLIIGMKRWLEDSHVLPQKKKRKATGKRKSTKPKAATRTLADRLADVKGKATGLPADASVNHDHYLYGAPKQQ